MSTLNTKETDKKTIIDTSYAQWSHGGNGLYYPVGITQEKLSPGVYTPIENQGQVYFYKQEIKIDDLMELPNSLSSDILNEVQIFWERAEAFKKYKFLHRRGILLVGAAGCGKTSIVQQVLFKLMGNGGTAFLCASPTALSHGLQVFRQIEPNRPVVCIFEDIDAIIRQFGEETILKILDGENQIDQCLNLATTNYPEQLDKRLTARPRRFDRMYEIGYPKEEVRRHYFKNKLQIDDNELEQWIKGSKDFSFAAMCELVISVKCLGNDFDKSIEVLKGLMTQRASSEDFKKNVVGFTSK